MPTGYFLEYESTIDGSPCVLIINTSTANPKVGFSLQTWYLRRDMKPWLAVKEGADASICGTCPRRHFLGGDCYVRPSEAATSIYKAFLNGRYQPLLAALTKKTFTRWMKSLPVLRMGAYGDPLSAPWEIQESMIRMANTHTGYTHMWRSATSLNAEGAKGFLMASCDSITDELAARALGWSTFTATPKPQPRTGYRASPCTNQVNQAITCAACLKCGGTKTKITSITAHEHGIRSKMKKLEV
jgi:hypothetical protein